MAGMIGKVVFSAASGTAAKTFVQLLAAANKPIRILGIGVGGQGQSVTGKPVQIDLCTQTTAGTMDAATVANLDGTRTHTFQTTATVDADAEPTTTTVLDRMTLHNMASARVDFFNPIIVAGGARIGLVITSDTDYTFAGYIKFEE